MPDTRPNIIFILADQWRGDCLGVDGHLTVQTPYLDDLAARGTRFRHAYSACPSCIPARAILWSGLNQWHTGVLGMGRGHGPIPNDFKHTLPGELTRAGYQTHLVGKGHFHPQRDLLGFQSAELDESGRIATPGFKDDYRTWFEQHAPAGVTPDDHGVDWNSWLARPWHTHEHLHPSAWIMSRAIDWLKRREQDRPFFLNISFERPHSPYVPPAPYWDMYLRHPTPPPYMGDWADIYAQDVVAPDPNAWWARLSDERVHRARSGYYGDISFIDTQLGRLLQWMRRYAPAVLANTWFVFASDHGDMLGDHHLWRKTYGYEGSARIPLIICPPKGSPRKVADEVVELRDIMPTLLDVAGVPCPKVDGQSMTPLLTDKAPWRSYIHGEHAACYAMEQEMHYVTDGRQKFIWLPRLGREQFFDLTADPGETRDLIDDPGYQATIKLWRDRLTEELARRDIGWVKDGRPYCPGPEPVVSPYKDKRY